MLLEALPVDLRRAPHLLAHVRSPQLRAVRGGRALLAKHGDSLHRLLRHALPMLALPLSELPQLPTHATDAAALRSVLDDCARALGVRRAVDWSHVRIAALPPSARAVVQRYRGSLSAALAALYPELPAHLFVDRDTARDAASECALAHGGVQRLRDLDALTGAVAVHWRAVYAATLGARFRAAQWSAEEEQRAVDALCSARGVQTYAQLADALLLGDGGGAALLLRAGLRSVLARAEQSPVRALRRAYPAWRPELSAAVRAHWLQSADDERALLQRVRCALAVDAEDDWYRLSRTDLERIGVEGALSARGHLAALLPRHVPHVRWEVARLLAAT